LASVEFYNGEAISVIVLEMSVNFVATAVPMAPQWMRWSYWKGSGEDRRSKK
jgi:hypothetical protein